MGARRKHWGWGYEQEHLSEQEQLAAASFLAGHLGFGSRELTQPVALAELELAAPTLKAPESLAPICSASTYERALHSHGSSYRDVVRAFQGQFEHVPDLIAHPRDEDELQTVMDWAIDAGAAVIPFGGGTSVVGGVEPAVDRDRFKGVVTIDLKALDQVLQVDKQSLAARIQAGALGPGLERQLGEHGLTLRHYPQSFEFSTLGGWIATRAAGHFATLETRIDDLVESVRALTPSGVWESRRLPGSGAGPSPDRLLLGSEGTLGVITEAWMRVRERPRFRSSAAVVFPNFLAGASAVRELSQSGLHPSNCRLIDPAEAALTDSGDGSTALLVLGFESPAYETEQSLELALQCCGDHGGSWDSEPGGGGSRGDGDADDAVASWRQAFVRAPYLRDTFVAMGILSETFETATTWDRFERLHRSVIERVGAAVRDTCGAGSVTCRFTHVYPDGPALYYTVLAPVAHGEELERWSTIKRAAGETVLDDGATITHHHAVGRDHRPWYDRQRPDPFAQALVAAKRAVDPTGALNPGVLIDA